MVRDMALRAVMNVFALLAALVEALLAFRLYDPEVDAHT